MDIDNFLDRELGAEQKQAVEISGEAATLLSNIQYLLAQKQFDQIEASYDSLWKKAAEGRFSWDGELYGELVAIHDQLNREIGAAFQDSSKKVQIIQQMIVKAKSLLASRQVEGASKLQNEAAAMVTEIPILFFQEKKSMEREVLRLQRDLHEAQSASALQKASALQREIMQQAARVRPYLLSGNIEAALHHYAQLIALYQQMPEGFLTIKIGLGKEMAEMYKSLAIQQEIERLKQQLNPMAQRRFTAPRQQPLSIADRHREQARSLLARKDYDAALPQVKAVLALVPGDPEGREMLERIQSAKRAAANGI